MQSTSRATIILPTYNECGNIAQLIEGIEDLPGAGDFELLVVDDDSPDGTGNIVRRLMERYPNLRLLNRAENRGLVPALRDGIQASTGEYCIWLDADLSMSPNLILELARAVENGADLAFGSRYIPGGGIKGSGRSDGKRASLVQIWLNLRDSEDSFLSVIISKVGNRIIRMILDPSLHDYTSGYFAARKSLLHDIGLVGTFVDYCIALPYRALLNGYTVRELPMVLAERKSGKSKTSDSLYSIFKIVLQCAISAIRLRIITKDLRTNVR